MHQKVSSVLSKVNLESVLEQYMNTAYSIVLVLVLVVHVKEDRRWGWCNKSCTCACHYNVCIPI